MSPPRAFILVTTLWFLAILTIAASFFALWTQRTMEVALTGQADIQGELNMLSTQATLLYLASTQRYTIGGLTVPDYPPPADASDQDSFLITKKTVEIDPDDVSILPTGGEIVPDDRPYFGYGNALFALQDEFGLINLNTEAYFRLQRFLSKLGIPVELQPYLIDKLQDYTDTDDFHRLNGAESYHYKQRHLPPPANRHLIHPLEVKRVMDWGEQTVLWQNHQLSQLTQLFYAIRPNINMAPSLVLQTSYNINEEAAERIINMREKMPFYELDTVFQVIGMSLDIDPYEFNYFPSDYSRLTLWYAGARRMRQVHIQFIHNAAKRQPWQIEYIMELELLPVYSEKVPQHTKTSFFDATLPAKAQ